VLALALGLASGLGSRAGAASDIPGADAVFAGRGVAIVWGTVRGADDHATSVVIWIASQDPAIRAVAVDLVDANGANRLEILPPSLIGKAREARVSRARFAASARARFRFAEGTDGLVSGASALTVSYTSIPATTPEFPSEEALTEYLESALARAAGR
jgi:hypothetical protein